MPNSDSARLAFFEKILDGLNVALTYADENGIVTYLNRSSKERPSDVPREVGVNLADCHNAASREKIAKIFSDFKRGRREPHHYVGRRRGTVELVTLIPIFEGEKFTGCLSQIHPLEFEEPERTFE